MRNRARGWFVPACVVVLGSVIPVTASAQEGQMNDEQVKHLNRANDALRADPVDIDGAYAAINDALGAGERYDLLLLTLGRVLQKRDECQKAKRAFSEISAAPHEPSVSREDIARIKERYINQMPQLCSGVVELSCVDKATELTIAGAQHACGESVKLLPGAYQVEARLGDQQKVYDIVLEGGQVRVFNVSLVATNNSGGGVEVVAPIETPPRSFAYKKTAISGITTVALTGALVGVYAVSSGRQQEEADKLGPLLNERGEWASVEAKAQGQDIVNEANRWGYREVASGWAAPIVATVGVAATVGFFMSERRASRAESSVSVGILPTRGGMSGGVMWRW